MQLDEKGLTFPLTPHMQNHFSSRTPLELLAMDSHFLDRPGLGYETTRGVTQGDTMSTACWVAVYDIILDLIATDDEDTADTAYADDLATTSSDPIVLQEKANLISAFCSFSGMSIHPTKVKVALVAPSTAQLPLPSFYHRTWDWKPNVIDYIEESEITYLGAQIPLELDDSASFQSCKEFLNSNLGIILNTRASVPAKEMIIRVQILPKLQYRANKASWPLRKYDALDRMMATALRKLYRLPASYPTSLLYLPSDQSGYNFPRISDQAQLQKWATLNRSIAIGGKTRDAALTMVQRATVDPPPFSLYLTSMLQWAKSFDVSLHVKTQEEYLAPDFDTMRRALQLDDPEMLRRFPIQQIVTDGSYTPRDCDFRDIFSSQDSLNSGGKGGIGIVWMGEEQDQKWKRQTPRCLYIETDEQAGLNSFACEILAQIFAYHISFPNVDGSVPAKSDCKAALARLLAAKSSLHVPLGHAKMGVFLESLIAQEEFHSRPSSHIPAHPERRHKNATLYSYDEDGIFIADASASGEWDKVSTHIGSQQYIKQQYHINDLLEMLIAPEIPHWRDAEGTPVTGDLMSLANRARADQYVHDRDYVHRAKQGLPPKWTGMNPALPMLATALPSKSSFKAKHHAVCRIWSKSYTDGYNRAKGQQGEKHALAIQCNDCKEPDSTVHMLLHCPQRDTAALREKADDEQKRILDRLCSDPAIPTWMRPPLKELAATCFDRSCEFADQLWTATFTPQQFDSLFQDEEAVTRVMTPTHFYTFKKAFLSLLTPLTTRHQQMINLRARRFLDANKPKRRLYPNSDPANQRVSRLTDPAILKRLGAIRLPPRPPKNCLPLRRHNNSLDSEQVDSQHSSQDNVDRQPRPMSQARLARFFISNELDDSDDDLRSQSTQPLRPSTLRLGIETYDAHLNHSFNRSVQYCNKSPRQRRGVESPPEGPPPD